MRNKAWSIAAALVVALPGLASGVRADMGDGDSPAAPGSTVQLPFQVQDNSGNQWVVYNQGNFQQQGNQPVYGQIATMQINGQQARVNVQQGKIDAKTKELVIELRTIAGVSVQRRFLFENDNSTARVIDCFTNTTDRDVAVNVTLTTNVNYGINDATLIDDPKKKDQNIGWTADTPVNRAVLELFAGKGSKSDTTVRWQQGNNSVNATYALKVPAKKMAAIIHWHGTFDSSDAAVKFTNALKESRVAASLSPEMRRAIVNLGTASGMVGTNELLRDETTDLIELRGGDQVRGTLQPPAYTLTTFYGEIALPAEKVIGMFNTGTFKPHQLLVTADGEIFGGALKETAVPIKLSSGQITQVPLTQLSRLGYRKREGEPEEWTFKQPLVLLRSGERMNIKPPTSPIDFITRYGPVKLAPESIAVLVLQSDEASVHDVYLTDGTKLSGLMMAQQLPLELTTASTEKPVDFPVAALARLQFRAAGSEDDRSNTPTLALASGDVLATRLTGELKFDTAFDTIAIDASQIRGLSRVAESATDVQIVLFDQTTLRGQLQTQQLKVTLLGGLEIMVPVATIEQYTNPAPFPAAGMVEKTTAAVADLSNTDWKKRDAAEAALMAMGPTVLSVLTEQRAGKPPEAVQRIDAIISKLKKDQPKGTSRLPSVPGLE